LLISPMLVLLCALALPAVVGAAEGKLPASGFHHDLAAQLTSLREAVIALPIATLLGAVLAFRPRRRATPPRSAAVIQTQIVLAVLGAVVMLVVGASLARAFGIVGATGLVRYRAKIEDPKDAGVMLSTLGIGLASGVGLYLLAGFATVFIMGVLWVVESLEPRAQQVFNLRVSGKEPGVARPAVERVLRRNEIAYELRSASDEALCYEVHVPYDRETDRVSDAILSLDGEHTAAVQWEEKKAKP